MRSTFSTKSYTEFRKFDYVISFCKGFYDFKFLPENIRYHVYFHCSNLHGSRILWRKMWNISWNFDYFICFWVFLRVIVQLPSIIKEALSCLLVNRWCYENILISIWAFVLFSIKFLPTVTRRQGGHNHGHTIIVSTLVDILNVHKGFSHKREAY